jgi:hypothetical protein
MQEMHVLLQTSTQALPAKLLQTHIGRQQALQEFAACPAREQLRCDSTNNEP